MGILASPANITGVILGQHFIFEMGCQEAPAPLLDPILFLHEWMKKKIVFLKREYK